MQKVAADVCFLYAYGIVMRMTCVSYTYTSLLAHYLTCFAGTLQHQRCAYDQQHWPERRSGWNICTRTAFRRVPAPLPSCPEPTY